MICNYNWLIVGAGLTGSIIAERLASQYDQQVLIIDRRNHIGGNTYDRRNEHGILYHQYGPHIFHTNSKRVVEYLSKFTEWQDYEHRVVGLINDRLVPIPFNLTSLEILFPPNEAKLLKELLICTYGMNVKIPILQMQKSPDERIQKLAAYIYQYVFLGYTIKQWGLRPEELDPSVTERVPIHISYDDRYFQDSFQKMPRYGYTKMFEKILDHPNITLLLKTEYNEIIKSHQIDHIVFTGMIDEFFQYKFGELPYRSLHFDFFTYKQLHHQSTGQVNYPVSQNFTRITEMGYLTQEWSEFTTIAIEYPKPYTRGVSIPYYPVPRLENELVYKKYKEFAEKNIPNVFFAGRLGNYKYFNMDQAVEHALDLVDKLMMGIF